MLASREKNRPARHGAMENHSGILAMNQQAGMIKWVKVPPAGASKPHSSPSSPMASTGQPSRASLHSASSVAFAGCL